MGEHRISQHIFIIQRKQALLSLKNTQRVILQRLLLKSYVSWNSQKNRMTLEEFKEKNKEVLMYEQLNEARQRDFRAQLDADREEKVCFSFHIVLFLLWSRFSLF